MKNRRKKQAVEDLPLADRFLALATKPPSKANRLIARHHKCNHSKQICEALVEAVRISSYSQKTRLKAPSALLPPLA